VKKSLLHIEFIFIDGQKTIAKDNTTIKSTAKKSNGFVMRLCASTNHNNEVLVETNLN